MKKILFALLVLCVSIISYTGVAADAMLDKLSANEKSLWEAIKNGDMKTFSAGLSDEIMDIDPSGVVYNKQQLVENLSKLKMTDYTLSDFQLFMLDKDSAVLSYVQFHSNNGWQNANDESSALYHLCKSRRQMDAKVSYRNPNHGKTRYVGRYFNLKSEMDYGVSDGT